MLRRAVRYPLLLMGLAGLALSEIASAHYVSPSDCAAEAEYASRRETGVVGGAVGGAARGAVLGAVIGDSGRDTRRGARIGAVVGGARNLGDKQRAYQYTYDNCMRGHHHPHY